MKQLIKINTLPLLSINDLIAYRGAVILILTNNKVNVNDPIYSECQILLKMIHTDIIHYNSLTNLDDKMNALLNVYHHRNKLNNKIAKYLLSKN